MPNILPCFFVSIWMCLNREQRWVHVQGCCSANLQLYESSPVPINESSPDPTPRKEVFPFPGMSQQLDQVIRYTKNYSLLWFVTWELEERHSPFCLLHCCVCSWQIGHLDGSLGHLQTPGRPARRSQHPRCNHPISSPHPEVPCGVSRTRRWWRYPQHRSG